MDAQSLLILLLAILTFDFTFNKVLEYLNIKSMKEVLPEEVKDIYDEEKYKKSIAYSKANNKFSLITSTFSFILSFVLLTTGFFGWLDAWISPYFNTEIIIFTGLFWHIISSL
jgi:STE24 endopeptidase